MISEHLWLTIIIRVVVSILIFGIILLFPQYIKQNIEKYQTRRSVNLFLLGYVRWYFTQLLRREREDEDVDTDEFTLVLAGIVLLAVILSLIPDDYISGLGVEISGAVLTAWTFFNYWSIRDVLQLSSAGEPVDNQNRDDTKEVDHDNNE